MRERERERARAIDGEKWDEKKGKRVLARPSSSQVSFMQDSSLRIFEDFNWLREYKCSLREISHTSARTP